MNLSISRGYWLLGSFAVVVLLFGVLVVEPRVARPPVSEAVRRRDEARSHQLPGGAALFVQFYRAARKLLEGTNPYAPSKDPRIALSNDVEFNHPPLTVLPYLPLGALGLRTAALANAALNALLMSLACFLAGRSFFPRKSWVPLACTIVWALWLPSWRLLVVGQNTAFVVFALFGWLWARGRGSPKFAGGLLAIAAIKPHTALLPGAFVAGASVVSGHRRVLASASIVIVLWAALITLIAPGSWGQYLAHLRELQPQTAYVSESLASRGVLAFGPVFRWIAYATFGAAVVAAFIVGASTQDEASLPARLSVAATASPCLFPHAYDYDTVMLLPFCVSLVGNWLDRARLRYLWLSGAWFLVVGWGILAQYRLGYDSPHILWWISWSGLAAQCFFFPLSGLQARRQ